MSAAQRTQRDAIRGKLADLKDAAPWRPSSWSVRSFQVDFEAAVSGGERSKVRGINY